MGSYNCNLASLPVSEIEHKYDHLFGASDPAREDVVLVLYVVFWPLRASS